MAESQGMEFIHHDWVPNEEGKDPEKPLPITSKDQIKVVKLYQGEGSPPCCVIRAFLTYAGVPFEAVEVDFIGKSQIEFSKYKKIPIVTVNGYQINDSYIIMKMLAPILLGRAPSETEIAQMDETTTKGQLSYECQLFEQPEKFADRLLSGGCMGWLMKMVAPFYLKGIPAKIMQKNPDLQPFEHYGKAFKSRFTTTFMGGNEPGPADLQMWALVALAKECKMEFIDQWLAQCDLAQWYDAVSAKIPKPIFSPP